MGAIDLMEKGLDIHTALDMGIANKSFDPYEQTLIRDTIQARISRKIQRKDVFRKNNKICKYLQGDRDGRAGINRSEKST